jgi:hypothetical protein
LATGGIKEKAVFRQNSDGTWSVQMRIYRSAASESLEKLDPLTADPPPGNTYVDPAPGYRAYRARIWNLMWEPTAELRLLGMKDLVQDLGADVAAGNLPAGQKDVILHLVLKKVDEAEYHHRNEALGADYAELRIQLEALLT